MNSVKGNGKGKGNVLPRTGHEGPQVEQMYNFDRGHPAVLIVKLQVYVYIYILISVRAQ